MTTVPKKTNRISKNSFCISACRGRQHLYYRDRVVTNFKPLNKKYLPPKVERAYSRPPSFPPTTTTANATRWPSDCLPVKLRKNSNWWKTTSEGCSNRRSRSVTSYFYCESALPQTQEQAQVLWGLQDVLRRLQITRGGCGPRSCFADFPLPAINSGIGWEMQGTDGYAGGVGEGGECKWVGDIQVSEYWEYLWVGCAILSKTIIFFILMLHSSVLSIY
jgi:hypothetical protein